MEQPNEPCIFRHQPQFVVGRHINQASDHQPVGFGSPVSTIVIRFVVMQALFAAQQSLPQESFGADFRTSLISRGELIASAVD